MDAKTSKIITIGRSFGAGGKTIGRMVADALGIPYYDSELLKETAENCGLSEKYLASVDEKDITDAALYMSVGFMTPTYTSVRQIAANAQREVIQKIASEGPCVIVGRRANEILKDKKNVVSVFVTASVEYRTKRIMEREGIDEKSARKKVTRVDKERAAYYNQFGGNNWGYASTYDLCINTETFGDEKAAELIVKLVMN
ncbi:MAG: cytidylate kinase-like family protein [Clostridiales bacterium]|nr:cytidylate kinase-like family protein [Clostridiales bacterium]MBR6488068.1 cytidylate kinase-like family protein [Clostridiales bacterium]